MTLENPEDENISKTNTFQKLYHRIKSSFLKCIDEIMSNNNNSNMSIESILRTKLSADELKRIVIPRIESKNSLGYYKGYIISWGEEKSTLPRVKIILENGEIIYMDLFKARKLLNNDDDKINEIKNISSKLDIQTLNLLEGKGPSINPVAGRPKPSYDSSISSGNTDSKQVDSVDGFEGVGLVVLAALVENSDDN